MLRRRHPSNDVKNETRRRHPSNDVGSAGRSVYGNRKLSANHDTRTPEKNEIMLRRRHPSNDVKNETRRRHPSNDVGSAGRSVYGNRKLSANHDTRTPEKNEIMLRRRHPSNDVKNETRRRHPSNDVGSAGRSVYGNQKLSANS